MPSSSNRGFSRWAALSGMVFAVPDCRPKDVHAVLREKEQSIELVRREIAALLAVIPRLEDGSFAPESNASHDATFAGTPD